MRCVAEYFQMGDVILNSVNDYISKFQQIILDFKKGFTKDVSWRISEFYGAREGWFTELIFPNRHAYVLC